ncbi:1-acyl-sn-glycerol-3-phosphate acyltransferase alpha [Nilaparvata lugens]|uniref:1-acyl-sn-glycerol-3-phosphate acyltransferase alpha n=1 Tax=Nilaparvata lugens TaxID=108931 RepID=UPI00193CFD25|nr:1-acyl-sn-glycerol-3-phosphate acyltransferase alpha [Nilaparvata lugens]
MLSSWLCCLKWELHLVPLSLLLICLLPLASNNKLRYHGCFIVYVVLVSLLAIVLMPVFIFRPKNVYNSLMAANIARLTSKLIGINWILRRGEVIKEERGAIIVSNHQSMFDILGMFDIWHVMDKCAAIAKKEIFYVWPFGLAAWLAGVVFIDRLNGKVANKQLSEISKQVFSNNIKMWIFPEGTRNRNRDKFLPFKKGAFKLAIHCQVPILPVVLSPYYFVNDEKKYFGRGDIIISCLDPISTEGMTEDDIEKLMEKTREVMSKHYDQLKEEVYKKQQSNYSSDQNR